MSETNSQTIDQLILRLQDEEENDAYLVSDQLAEIGGEYLMDKMVELLYAESDETQHLAARTLASIEDNSYALKPLLEAINDDRNKHRNGALVEALEGFDCSGEFVNIFRLFLFGSYKVSRTAKQLLDYTEFDITPRVIKKADKHWKHYINNTKHDDAFELMKSEVEQIFAELRALFEDEE
ncbi:MAG: HEAT repeat domain-containing protein [Bacteroidota bacterium]